MEVYLDNSATTKPYAQVVEEMCKALTEDFANPSENSDYQKTNFVRFLYLRSDFCPSFFWSILSGSI